MRVDGKWFLMRLRPYRTVEDRIEGLVITFIDISKLKETEQELVRAKELLEERVRERTRVLDEANAMLTQARDLFHALFNANPIPASLIRMEDNIIEDVNEEFLQYFGLQRDEVIGYGHEPFNALFGEEGFSRDSLLEQVRREGRVQNYEREIRLPSGEIRNVLGSIQSIQLDGKEALISTFIDITDRVRAEREIRSLASDLTAAEQEERKRVSQILHDDLQQRIFAVKVQLSAFQNAILRGDMQSAQLDVTQLQNMLDESIAITRNLSIDLSPAILQGDSLVDSLVWLSNQMRNQYGLNVTVEWNEISTRFDDTLRSMLFQAVRESLFNVVKHAGTLNASVSFEEADGYIRLTINDKGVGFDAAGMADDPTWLGGLMNIRHRLSLMGCQLQIQSQPGKGTQVIIDIPKQQVN